MIKGFLLAFLAVFLWSFNSLIAQRFSLDVTPLELATGRWTFAALILLPFTAHDLKKNIPFFRKNLLWLFTLGICGMVIDNTLIYLAGHTISASQIGILSIIGPIFLALLSYLFLKTPITKAQILGMSIALIGIITVITNGNLSTLKTNSFPIGYVFIIINAFCFAVYSFLQVKKPPQMRQTTLLNASILAALLVLYPLTIFETGLSGLIHLSELDYSLFIYLGVFNSVFGYLAWNSALIKIGAVKTGIIYYFLPILTAIEAYFLLNDPLTLIQIIGAVFVITGITLVSKTKHLTVTKQHKQKLLNRHL